jgi:hypothetical protein
MNNHETKSNRPQVDTAPLFASVWLALFNELRKQYIERRLAAAENVDCSQV